MDAILEQFCKFLNIFWKDNEPKDAVLIWNHQVQSNPGTAREYLNCLDQVTAEPPDNLKSLMEEQGWIALYHEGSDTPYTTAEYLDWLKDMTVEFQSSYNEFIDSPVYSLRQLLQEFFLNNSASQTLTKWQELVNSCPERAKSLLNGASRLIAEAPAELPDIIQTYARKFLYHNDNKVYSFNEHAEWLKGWLNELEKIYTDNTNREDRGDAH